MRSAAGGDEGRLMGKLEEVGADCGAALAALVADAKEKGAAPYLPTGQPNGGGMEWVGVRRAACPWITRTRALVRRPPAAFRA